MIRKYVPITLTLDELWLLQSFVRHELGQQDTWKNPPASLELNDQIADALIACIDAELSEHTLLVTRAELLILDYVVPQSATSTKGEKLGREILIKSFRARRALDTDEPLSAQEPEEWEERLIKWKNHREEV